MPKSFGIEEQAELALSKWQNRAVDREPILITAQLGRAIGSEQIDLLLMTFDEDKDIVGFGIREEYADANGMKTLLTEEYLAFVDRMRPEVLHLWLFSVQIRGAGQRMDPQVWDEYIKGKGIDDKTLQGVEGGRDALPPVWVSVPEPNRVDVYVYVYDQAGRKSDPVRLLTPFRDSNYTPTPEQLFWRKVRMDRHRSVERAP